MLPSSATAMQKEQLKRKARDMGYKTMTFDTALAAARARHAIMDGKGLRGLARLSSHDVEAIQKEQLRRKASDMG